MCIMDVARVLMSVCVCACVSEGEREREEADTLKRQVCEKLASKPKRDGRRSTFVHRRDVRSTRHLIDLKFGQLGLI